MNETDRKSLTLLIKTLYPYLHLPIPFRWAKRDLMRVTELNRWDFDKWLLDLQAETSDEGTYAFYLLKCGSYPTSRLHYVSWGKRNEETFQNSYCFLQFDSRNKYMQVVLTELERRQE